MRALRFLGPGVDDNHLIVETADGGEQFVLSINVALRDAARSDLPRLHPSAPEPEATISPREIQMRVRAGVSPQKLAEEHVMTLERVLRFAGPVLDERRRVADEARRAKARRSTTEGQTVVFGEAVDGRFTAHGIDPSTVTWDAHRRADGQWVVTAGWVGGDANRAAEWVFHLAARQVTPVDDTAADLLSDRPIHPIMPLDEPARPSLVAAPPLARGVVAFPPMVDDVFDQDATADDPRQVTPRRASSKAGEPDPDFHAPPLPLRLAEATETAPAGDAPAPSAARTTRLPKVTNLGLASRQGESDKERSAHPKVPSWDDILLGVRRKSD